MSRAAIVFGSEWNLPMADLLAVHVGLKDSIDGRCRVLYFRCAIGPAPDAAIAIAHAAGVLGIGDHGMEQLAVPVDQPCRLRLVVVALLLNPKAALLIAVDVDRIGPSGRCQKQLGGLRHSLGDLFAPGTFAHATAERVRPRRARRSLGGLLRERRDCAEVRAHADSAEQLSSPDEILHGITVNGSGPVVNALGAARRKRRK